MNVHSGIFVKKKKSESHYLVIAYYQNENKWTMNSQYDEASKIQGTK